MNAAIYQWFSSDDGSNFDKLLFLSDNGESLRYYEYNFLTDEYRLVGSMLANDIYVLGDGKNVFFYRLIAENTWGLAEYVWRGHCFSFLGNVQTPAGVFNNSRDGVLLPRLNRFAFTGAQAFEHGVASFDYDPDNLQQPYTNTQLYTQAWDDWIRIYDVQQDNIGDKEIGIGLVVTRNNINNAWTTFEWDDILEEFAYVSGVNKGGMTNPQHNRFSRYITGFTGAVCEHISYDNDLIISDAGSTTVSSNPYVAIVDASGYLITVEDGPATNQFVRSYSLAGVLQDEFELDGYFPPTRIIFLVSPYTGRLWLFGAASGPGLSAFSISDTGQITRDGYVPGESAMNAGGFAHARMSFFPTELQTTSNGFTGIKEKLFECWEMDEVGTGTRFGSMGNMDLIDAPGTTGNVTDVGGETYFDGTAALSSDGETLPELQSISNYSLCFQVTPDAIPGPSGDQHVWKRGKLDSIESGGSAGWDCGFYINSSGNFIFWVNTMESGPNFSPYTVQAGSLVAVGGTKYDVYVEFDRINNQISIRVNNGTVYSTAIPILESHNVWWQTDRRLFIGQYTTQGSDFRRYKGKMSKTFWFYDVLTSAQQDWMYNNGNGRAFSEL